LKAVELIFFCARMYAGTHIHTHQTFYCAIRKFYFVIKKRRETIIIQKGVTRVTRRSCIVIAACNKRALATSLAGRPHLVARLH